MFDDEVYSTQEDPAYTRMRRFLAMANIFSPQQFTSDNTSQPSTNNSSSLDKDTAYQGMISKMMNPREDQFNKFNTTIDDMPQRGVDNPGFWTKLRAHIAAMGADNTEQAHNLIDQIENPKYYKAMQSWGEKLKPLEESAKLEGSRNVNDRQVTGQLLSNDRASRRQTEVERENSSKDQDRADRTQIAQQRADAYAAAKRFSVDHPSYKTLEDKSGKVFFYDPTHPDAKPIPSGISKLSEMEKIDLKVAGSLEEIGARSKAASSLEGQKQGNRLTLEDVRAGNRQSLQDNKTDKTKPESATQTKVKYYNKAVEARNTHPEWKDYITIQQGNNFDIKAPEGSEGLFGLGAKKGGDPKVVDDINKFIYGSATPNNKSETKPIEKEIPGHPGKYAVSSDGGKTWKAK